MNEKEKLVYSIAIVGVGVGAYYYGRFTMKVHVKAIDNLIEATRMYMDVFRWITREGVNLPHDEFVQGLAERGEYMAVVTGALKEEL